MNGSYGTGADLRGLFDILRSVTLSGPSEWAYPGALDALLRNMREAGWVEDAEAEARLEEAARVRHAITYGSSRPRDEAALETALTYHERTRRAPPPIPERNPGDAWSVRSILSGPDGAVCAVWGGSDRRMTDARVRAMGGASGWDAIRAHFETGDAVLDDFHTASVKRRAGGEIEVDAQARSATGRDGWSETFRVTRLSPADIDLAAALGRALPHLTLDRSWSCRYL